MNSLMEEQLASTNTIAAVSKILLPLDKFNKMDDELKEIYPKVHAALPRGIGSLIIAALNVIKKNYDNNDFSMSDFVDGCIDTIVMRSDDTLDAVQGIIDDIYNELHTGSFPQFLCSVFEMLMQMISDTFASKAFTCEGIGMIGFKLLENSKRMLLQVKNNEATKIPAIAL